MIDKDENLARAQLTTALDEIRVSAEERTAFERFVRGVKALPATADRHQRLDETMAISPEFKAFVEGLK